MTNSMGAVKRNRMRLIAEVAEAKMDRASDYTSTYIYKCTPSFALIFSSGGLTHLISLDIKQASSCWTSTFLLPFIPPAWHWFHKNTSGWWQAALWRTKSPKGWCVMHRVRSHLADRLPVSLFVFSYARCGPHNSRLSCCCVPWHTHTLGPPMDSQTDYRFLFSGYWAYFTCSYLPHPAPHHKRGPVPIQQLTRTTNWWIHCPWPSAPVTKLIVAVNQHNCSFPLPTNPVQPLSARGYFQR